MHRKIIVLGADVFHFGRAAVYIYDTIDGLLVRCISGGNAGMELSSSRNGGCVSTLVRGTAVTI